MEISTAHHQAIPNHNPDQQKKPRPQPEQALRCPRCDSTNTKFCYYNNYSLSQPRYFCKGCRRYWTKGGSLRNVPVGGGCRKNKRTSPPALSNSPSKKQNHKDNISPTSLFLPSMPLHPLTYDNISLAFSSFNSHDPFLIGNSNNANGFCNNYGFSGGGGDDYRGVVCFDGVGGGRDSTAVVVGNSEGGNNGNGTGLVMESGRDYWSGVNGVNCSWQGIINSSLL